MRVVAIVQARMGSSRLPGKVLRPLGGRPMILRLIDRIRRSDLLDDVVVATSRGSSDDALVETLEREGVHVHRGSEDDVLGRYFEAATRWRADAIVRLTGDCPFADPALVDHAIRLFMKGDGLDYLTNVLPPTYPDGLDLSVFSMQTLLMAHEEARLPSEREHVVPWMWAQSDLKNGERLRAANFSYTRDLSALRLTVDEPEDYTLAAIIAEHFADRLTHTPWETIVDYIKERPALAEINSQIERDEGYLRSLKRDREWRS